MPQRIQLKRTKGWRMPENAVKVDRSTMWGNPYSEGAALWLTKPMCAALYDTLLTGGLTDEEVGEAAARYRRWVLNNLDGLRGKDLACWCKLPAPYEPDRCHAAVLLKLANA